MDTEYNVRLHNRARNTMTFQLIYDDHKEDGFSAVLWDQFVNRYRFNNQDYTYNTLNFSMNKKWTNSFSTYAGIDNIFNKKIGCVKANCKNYIHIERGLPYEWFQLHAASLFRYGMA